LALPRKLARPATTLSAIAKHRPQGTVPGFVSKKRELIALDFAGSQSINALKPLQGMRWQLSFL
jgi:hypothetical protein